MTRTDDSSATSGEARYRRRRRNRIIYYFAAGGIGALIGFTLSRSEQGEGNFLAGDISGLSLDPTLSILLALALIVGLLVVPLWGFTQVDELEIKNNLIGMATGGLAAIGAYPTWAVLAMGDWLPEPTAFGLFAICFLTMMVAHFIMKLRN